MTVVHTQKSHQKATKIRARLPSPRGRAWALLSLAVLFGCASARDVSEDYRMVVHERMRTGELHPVAATTVLFLVDGLGQTILDPALASRSLPVLRSFFAAPEGSLVMDAATTSESSKTQPVYPLGRAAFPSLTYPNLVSVLSGESVQRHQIMGNRVRDLSDISIKTGQPAIINFENVMSWKKLAERTAHVTAFNHLTLRKEPSISYSYPFPYASSAQQGASLDAAMNYTSKDYFAVDQNTLASLATLLESTPYAAWPRFIFVHLISVDSMAHEFGPRAKETQNTLRQLDRELTRTFAAILKAESAGRSVSTVLTADHGFVEIRQKIPIADFVNQLPPKLRPELVADNRISSFYFPRPLRTDEQRMLAAEFARIKHISWTVLKPHPVALPVRTNAPTEQEIELFHFSGRRASIFIRKAACPTHDWQTRFVWSSPTSPTAAQTSAEADLTDTGYFCPEDFDDASAPNNQTFWPPALVEYFLAPNAPDMIALPDATSDFSGEYRGNHGGISNDEMLVPLLSRRAPAIRTGVVPANRLLHRLRIFDDRVKN